jgi:hypothetical protein
MRVYFDERRLADADLRNLLISWREIADFANENANGLALLLDKQSLANGDFLRRFNLLKRDLQTLFVPMLFGSDRIGDWRPESVGGDSLCQLETEHESFADCAICETYAHHKVSDQTALFGHLPSSFVGRQTVGISKIEPPEPTRNVLCGTGLPDFQRIGTAWKCLILQYDQALQRPPRDSETALMQQMDRFMRVGRIERSGRRQVFRELATGRLFYVDNLHHGPAAHLEVFDPNELHLGTANLHGDLVHDTRIAGRRILW